MFATSCNSVCHYDSVLGNSSFSFLFVDVHDTLKQIITDISYDHYVMITKLILATKRKQFKKVNGQDFFQVSGFGWGHDN